MPRHAGYKHMKRAADYWDRWALVGLFDGERGGFYRRRERARRMYSEMEFMELRRRWEEMCSEELLELSEDA